MTEIPTFTGGHAERLIRTKEPMPAEYHVAGALFLRICDLAGVTLPASISGSLDLRGCNLRGVTLPTRISGLLDLRGCNLRGITLPASISGWLDLSGCDLAGVTLPASIGGSLYLRGCDLASVTLPTSISGWLYLGGAKNFTGPSHWIARPGKTDRFRVLACYGEYHLEQTESDLFTAGCRKLLTRAEALAHWDRPDARAVLATAAIKAATL